MLKQAATIFVLLAVGVYCQSDLSALTGKWKLYRFRQRDGNSSFYTCAGKELTLMNDTAIRGHYEYLQDGKPKSFNVIMMLKDPQTADISFLGKNNKIEKRCLFTNATFGAEKKLISLNTNCQGMFYNSYCSHRIEVDPNDYQDFFDKMCPRDKGFKYVDFSNCDNI